MERVARTTLLAATITTGALAIAAALRMTWVVGFHLPNAAVSTAAVVTALIAARVLPDVLPDSTWRIPERWARSGQTVFSAIFGLLLGAGVVTARPSVGYPVILMGALALSSSWMGFAVLGAFGVARGVIAYPVAWSQDPGAVLSHLSALSSSLLGWEIPLLLTAAVLFVV
jgi:hypothetical protein